MLSAIWELSQHMTAQHIMRISYCRQDSAECAHEVNPVAIMFSEYYFYLIAYLADGRKEFPTIFASTASHVSSRQVRPSA